MSVTDHKNHISAYMHTKISENRTVVHFVHNVPMRIL